MAASGIAEHDEARRRETRYLHKAYLMKQSIESEKDRQRQLALDISLGKKQPSRHDNASCEVQRRTDTYNYGNSGLPGQRSRGPSRGKEDDYSAKLPHRYTSIDYQSQW